MDIYDIATRVKRGVKLLDKKVPNWRLILRKNREQFNFADGSCCVLGTLEHFSGRMRVLKAKRDVPSYEPPFSRAIQALGIVSSKDYGFDWSRMNDGEEGKEALTALWRAEFEK